MTDTPGTHSRIPPEWTASLAVLARISAATDRAEVVRAHRVLSRVVDDFVNDIPVGWEAIAIALLSNCVHTMQSAVNAIERLPTENAYASLDAATVATLKALPAARELVSVALDADASSLLEEVRRLDVELSNAGALLTQKSKRYEQLVALAADDTLAASYAEEAVTESRRADHWRAGAVTALVFALVLTAVIVVRHVQATKTNVSDLAARAALTAALAAFGTYLQRQATMHRGREEAARAAELRLRTVGPFTAHLSEESAARLREQVGLSVLAQEAQAVGLINRRGETNEQP
jgi:hypothetical protein